MNPHVFDIETDGFNPSKIHVLCVDTGTSLQATNKYDNMRSWLSKQEVIVAHNCIRFDLPVMKRILGVDIKARVVDTLALSWYLYPNRASHGLESWGVDFGVPKPAVTDWENLTYEEYKHRCMEDVKINKLLWNKCWEYLLRLYGSEEEAFRLIDYLTFKMECARDQEALKWKLDVGRCHKVLGELSVAKDAKVLELFEAMPKLPINKLIKKPAKMYKASGALSEAGKKWLEVLKDNNLPESHDDDVVVTTGYADPNPNSHIQVKDWLYSLGWEPETFEFKRNKETNEFRKIPQVYGDDGVCPSIKKLFVKEPKLEVLDGLSTISHRLGIMQGLSRNVDAEGYVKAQIAGLTNTLRFKHSVLVNLPGVDKPYGEDIRGCLITPEGYTLCGSDMSSLEDRTKQHYMWEYDPDYVKEMMTDDFDPHIDLATFAGAISSEDAKAYKQGTISDSSKKLVGGTRKVYKGVNYACVYGAGAATVGRTAGVSTEEGAKLVEAYWRRNWSVRAIAEAQEVRVVFGQSWLYNPVSKLWYSLRAEKDKFSTLNQGTGVFCFDTWVGECKKEGLDIIGQFHDEIIALVKEDAKEETTDKINNAMKKCNEKLALNRELGCSIQFGKTYADIH